MSLFVWRLNNFSFAFFSLRISAYTTTEANSPMYHPFKDAMRGTLSSFPTGGKPLTIRWNSPNGRRSLITNVSSKSVPFVVPSYGSAFHPCIYFPTHPLSNNRFVLQTRYARTPILIYTTMRNRLPTPRCYPHSRDLRARAAPPALLDTQPF